MKHLSHYFALAALLGSALSPLTAHAATTGTFAPGDLIKGTQTSTVYYFGPDGRRYVFPNERTYFTWYKDFSKVVTISDGQLGTIPLGKTNVTYRPGYKMVKITTDSKAYVVDQGGVLRHVGSEQLAETLYGLNWKNRIDDIADAFFINYKIGTPIQTASDYNAGNVMTGTPTISIDKQFDETMVTVTIGNVNNGFVPTTTTIKAGHTVTWTNADNVPHRIKGKDFDSGDIAPGKTYTRKFSTVGSYDYTCTFHPVMQGTINVVS